MSFPGAIPSYAGFTSSDTLKVDNHAAQHNAEQADISALGTKVGTGASTPASGLLLRGNGAGTSVWAQANPTTDVSGVLPQANGGTGTTLATGTGKAVYDTSPTISGAALTASPTLTTPTIADFTNSPHDHGDADDGGQIVSGAIPADAINDSQMIFGKVRSRQGGSATDWSSQGTSSFDPSATNTFVQVGAIIATAGSYKTVTFPTAFSQVPVVIAAPSSASGFTTFVTTRNHTATGFDFACFDITATARAEEINWIAIGV